MNKSRLQLMKSIRRALFLAAASLPAMIAAVPTAGYAANTARIEAVSEPSVQAHIETATTVDEPMGHAAASFDPMFNEPQYSDWGPGMGADCGMGCPSTWRVRGELLYYNREGETGISRSSAVRLSDFDYEKSGRITVGRKYDCTVGWEISYTGPIEWEQRGTAVGAGTLNSTFVPSGVNISAFNGANFHQQSYRSELRSLESSQKWWGWDVITTSVGLRYLEIDESFGLNSVDANGDLGFFSTQTENQLIGPQLGIEMLYPIGSISFDSTFKGGIYANWGESDTRLINAGVVQLNNTAEDVEFAATLEGGYYLRFALTPRIIARAGYEFLWIYGLGIAPEQVTGPLIPTSGNSFDGQGDTFYHGAALGVEVIW